MFVRSHISNVTSPNFTKFYVRIICGRGSVPLTIVQYAIYFRFCGWRHVFA